MLAHLFLGLALLSNLHAGSSVAKSVGSSAYPLLAPDGTSAAPSYSFSSEAGLGLSRDAGGSLKLSSANTTATRFYLDTSNGNNANAYIYLSTKSGGTGDAWIGFTEAGVDGTGWIVGRDDSASSQFKISQDGSAIGTNDKFILSLLGQLGMGGATIGAGQAYDFGSLSTTTLTSGVTQTGMRIRHIGATDATTAVIGQRIQVGNPATTTTDRVMGIFLDNAVNGGTLNNALGIVVSNQSTGTVNASITDTTGPGAGNWFLYQATTTYKNFLAGPTAIGGTTTNDSAASGFVGELLTANSAGVTPAASNSFINVVSKSLTAGDWDVDCNLSISEAATLAATRAIVSVSTSTGAQDSTNNGGIATENSFLVSSTAYIPTGARRISLSATTTVYCVAAMTYTVLSTTTYTTDSIIRARRMR